MVSYGPYNYVPVGVDTTVSVKSPAFGGSLCPTSGTITITVLNPNIVILNAFPVTAGEYYPFPMKNAVDGATFVTAGGASGLLLA